MIYSGDVGTKVNITFNDDAVVEVTRAYVNIKANGKKRKLVPVKLSDNGYSFILPEEATEVPGIISISLESSLGHYMTREIVVVERYNHDIEQRLEVDDDYYVIN